ncbi:MAG: nickel pincer cofactor biosynthesis protein LarC [Desulfobacteraceae bacterium]|nr:nickel pincer cofactor biosynthesis protein LarC [Desulfobacteraceae bacterium]MBU4053578.1 nickel pincer cofactor biosynthesis protein LarC [Pseudomonadota bacterium]
MIAYFDCFSGISGDMTLGALVDLGVPVKWLKETISGLPLQGFDMVEQTVSRNGISAKLVDVVVDEGQPIRDYHQIKTLIEKSPLSDRVKQTALNIFQKIAEAESLIHNAPIDKVHFHEVGGVDAIVDVCGAALGMEYLKIEQVVASKLPLGSGLTRSMHGVIPIPAPATLEILKHVPTYGSGIPFELVTPTGAGIIATLAGRFGKMPEMRIEKTGYGSGQRILESQPNLLRIILGSLEPAGSTRMDENCLEDDIVILETNIDDMNPEWFGFLMEQAQSAGALDVSWHPIQMKKNRPGTLVQMLCHAEQKTKMVEILLRETTSIGIRCYEAHRYMLKRETVILKTSYGDIQMKKITGLDGRTRLAPEYDVCRKIALEKNIPIKRVYDTLLKEAVD